MAQTVHDNGQPTTTLDSNIFSRVGVPLYAQMGVPHPFEDLRSDADRFAEANRPFLTAPDAFVSRVWPVVNEHMKHGIDLNNLIPLGDSVKPEQVRMRPNAAEFRGENYTATQVTINGRPHLLFRKDDGSMYAIPVEHFLDIREWISPGINAAEERKRQQQAPPQQQPQPQNQPQQQPQQQSMNLFEYMSKLPPQERMVFTVLLYLLISETLGRIFQRGGGRQQPPIAYGQSPWMPGPPKGQQWMIWG